MKKGANKAFLTILLLAILGTGGYFAYKHFLGDTVTDTRTSFRSSGGLQVHIEERSFFSHGKKIYGTVYLPQDGTGTKPLLVYSHGMGQNADEADRICRSAASLGFMAYAFDFRGGSKTSRSDGDYLKMSYKTEVSDLDEVLGRLLEDPSVDKSKVFLIGHSLGALVSSVEGCDNPKKIKGMVLVAPAYNLPDVAKMYYPDYNKIADSTEILGNVLGKRFFQDLHGSDPYKKMSKYPGDVLLIHGDMDDVVPISYSEKAAGTFKSCTFKVYPGIGHSFAGSIGTQFRSDIADWLKERI